MTNGQNNNPYNLLFVDLDGTLIRSDLFFESILIFLKQKPFNFLQLIVWLIKGRSIAKTMVARNVDLEVENLPYETELIEYIKLKRTQGCQVILATASHWFYARKVAAHLGLFDEVMATNAKYNLKSTKKLKKIRKRANGEPFAYAGDSVADRPIWKAATANIHVNAKKSDIDLSVSQNKLEKVINSRPSTIKYFIKGMRIHQYAKNALIFVPLITSHSYSDAALVLAVLLGFICFSLCASGVYFLNDLLDLTADRQHPTKRNRPLASGNLSLIAGVIGSLCLPVLAFCIAFLFLPFNFVIILAIYFIITNFYSFYLKRLSTADVIALAVLFTLRVIAGAAAIGVVPSSWLLAFSVFVFVSLAYLKRYIEVSAMSKEKGKAEGRGYAYADSESIFTLGVSNSTASILVLALYISSSDISTHYPSPQILWLLCLLMLFWTNRLWIGARRGKINDDPVLFALKDSVSRLILIAFGLVILAARFL